MKNINRKSSAILPIIFIIIVSLMIISYGHTMGKRPEIEDHKIGVVLSLTDRGATYGQRALKGMQLAIDEINAKEPFRSNPIKLIVEDSKSSAQQALSAFRKLVDIDHVFVTIGFVLSDEVLTCAPVANDKKVVLLTTAAGSDKIKDAGDYIFRNRESASLQTQAIASTSVERFGFEKIAILHSNSANGVSYRDGFKDAVEKLGGRIIASVGYNEGKTDYRSEIEQLRASSPKAVYLAGLDNEMGLILKQSKEVGFKTQFFASPGAISQRLLDIAKNSAEGLVCASAPFNIESDDSRVRSFTAAFKSHFGETPDFIAANSYDAIYMISDLFKKGTKNGDQIKEGLYAVKDYPGVGGKTTFDSYGEVTKPIVLVQVKHGKFQQLDISRQTGTDE